MPKNPLHPQEACDTCRNSHWCEGLRWHDPNKVPMCYASEPEPAPEIVIIPAKYVD